MRRLRWAWLALWPLVLLVGLWLWVLVQVFGW